MASKGDALKGGEAVRPGALPAGCREAAVRAEAARQAEAMRAEEAIPVGLQLYSVRGECAKDLPGTIAAVARMGYRGVEFAGYHGRAARDLRKMLDDSGLVCCGTHIALETLLGDALGPTIEFNQVLGNRFLIVPSLAEKRRSSRKAWQETAALFNAVAAKVQPHGMRTGYHNHAIEFQPLEGEKPWDTFFGHTVRDVVMQLDTGNAMHGGGDPVEFLKKYPGRATTVHLKPFSKAGPRAVIGEDDLPWPEIFRLCETVGGTEWYIVEYEAPGVPALEAVARCLDTLRKLGRA